MRLQEFSQPEFKLSESDAAAILAVRKEDFFPYHITEGPEGVIVFQCPLFVETYEYYRRHKPAVGKNFERFLSAKIADPLQRVGNDGPYTGEGPLHGILHCRMDGDIRLLYDLEGRNPRIIKLYGFFRHDESGTGRPPKINLQKQLKTRIGNQKFTTLYQH